MAVYTHHCLCLLVLPKLVSLCYGKQLLLVLSSVMIVSIRCCLICFGHRKFGCNVQTQVLYDVV